MTYIPGTTSDEIIADICNDVGNAALSKDSARLALRELRATARREVLEAMARGADETANDPGQSYDTRRIARALHVQCTALVEIFCK